MTSAPADQQKVPQLPLDWPGRAPRRSEELEIEPAADGFIVYQADRDRVHYLNHTAALVLEMCAGALPAGGIGALLARLYSLGEPPQGDVESALRELTAEGLIAWPSASGDTPP